MWLLEKWGKSNSTDNVITMSTYKKKWPARSYLGPAAEAKRKYAKFRDSIFALVRKTRKPIRSRTPQRARDEAKYRARVKVWIVGKKCVICQSPSVVCHHKRGRRGVLLLYEPLWVPVCNSCHDWIHDRKPGFARQLGLLAPIGQCNNPPPKI